MNCHKYQCTGYSKHLEPKTISNTMQTTGTLASSEYQSDSKQDILTLNTNTPKKRHRRRFRPQSVERGTNVTEEFILAPDELKQQRKREKKITTKYLDGPAEDKELEVTRIWRDGPLLSDQTVLKFLLVYTYLDTVIEALQKAAEMLKFDATLCHSSEDALQLFQSILHHLVIIDVRFMESSKYETLCRSIRTTRGSLHTVLVALISKSVIKNDNMTVVSLLEAGFHRCLVEGSNVVMYTNELIQIKHTDLRARLQHASCRSLCAALDKCKEIVFITDDVNTLKYANKSSKKHLGYRPNEILGTSFQKLVCDQLQWSAMNSNLSKGQEWQGLVLLKRRTQEPFTVICNAVPVYYLDRIPTHYVLVMDSGDAFKDFVTSEQTYGFINLASKTSADLPRTGSAFLQQTSVAQGNGLPIETPVNKIITLITQAQNANKREEMMRILDKVMEILHLTELHAAQMKQQHQVRSDEPVASDLLGALLSHQPANRLPSSRRNSTDFSLFRKSRSGHLKMKVPVQLRDILDTSLSWEFDIFGLEHLCDKRPLQHLGMNLLLRFDVPNVLSCDENILYNWLTVIELNYHAENTYHNSTHAADVMQATACFLEKERMKSIMEPLDEAASLVAAAAHDVDHPGKSSAFLSNSDNPLAILYNDVTVLEMHHASLTFKLTLGDDRINIFKNLDRDVYKIARHNVIDMILATEMTKHFEHLAKFVNVFCTNISTEGENEDYIPIAIPENVTLVKRMMIKCADVSNPTRPLELCVEWGRRIAEEYFQQTDEEKTRGLPVVMPMFDRQTCSIPKSQIGFVDYIINDMFEAWNAFIDMPELIAYMRQNYITWKELDEQGYTTLTDIGKLQASNLLSPLISKKRTNK